jgi:hypothetical protein
VWITAGELTAARQQPEYDIRGINETMTELGFVTNGLRDEVYPVDTAGKTRGDYTVVFQFIPNSDAHPLVDGGAYSLAMYTKGLTRDEGMLLQFGEIFIAAEDSQVSARREAKRLQTEIVTLIEKYLTGQVSVQSHQELFQIIMKEIQGSGFNFVKMNSSNPVGFR